MLHGHGQGVGGRLQSRLGGQQQQAGVTANTTTRDPNDIHIPILHRLGGADKMITTSGQSNEPCPQCKNQTLLHASTQRNARVLFMSLGNVGERKDFFICTNSICNYRGDAQGNEATIEHVAHPVATHAEGQHATTGGDANNIPTGPGIERV